jgi:hypothetical protein
MISRMLKHRLKKHDSPTTIPMNILYVKKTIIGKNINNKKRNKQYHWEHLILDYYLIVAIGKLKPNVAPSSSLFPPHILPP